MASHCLNGSDYAYGCRCAPCVQVHYRYNETSRRRGHERAWGKTFPTDRVDPGYAQKVVWDAHAVRGMTFVQIARVTGLNKKTIRNLYVAKQKYIERGVEDAIREKLDRDWIQLNRKPTELVDKTPYYDIFMRLLAQGWTTVALQNLLEEHTSYNTGFLDNMARRSSNFLIEWRNAQAVMWLADFIGDTEGPSRRTRIRMQNRGIFPMIHYNESGELIVDSLLPEQRAILKRLRSKHGNGKSSSSGDGV